ncbi:MAG: tetratricopeptide repeat protein [SAR324 cluster bacterium]|nr:tetratricopeptide repeat protein [SAR324 cluster bacterium]
MNRDQSSLLAGFFLLLILIPLAYSPVIEAGFIIDDSPFYIEDPIMNEPDGLLRIWLHRPGDRGEWPYIPVTRSTFWLERQLGGLNLHFSHGINVVLHLTAALILWLGLRQFQFRGSFWIGLLFGLHPIYVQSVAWIAERKNGVAGVFFLLTVWSFLHYEKKKTGSWYGLTILLFLGAVLSKTSSIMLPVLFLFCRLYLRSSWKKTDFFHLLPFFLAALGFGIFRIWVETHTYGAQGSLYTLSFLERLLIAGHIPFFYIEKLLFPFPLIFTYPKWQVDPAQILFYLPLLSLGVAGITVVWKGSSWGRPLFLGLGSFLALLFPVLSFFNIGWTRFSYVSDHWVHLPSIPLLILLVEGVIRVKDLIERRKTEPARILGLGLLSLVFILLGILTWNQAGKYKNHKTLWQATLADFPNAWLAHQELGRVYMEENQFPLALQHLDQAIGLNSQSPDAYNNRGAIYSQLQQYDQAFADYKQALDLHQEFLEAYYNRGKTYAQQGNYDRAFADYNRILQLNPRYAKAYHSRGTAYAELERYQEALQDFTQALQLNPQVAETHFNQGQVYLQLQQFQQALQSYNKTLQIESRFLGAYNNRGYLHHLAGNETLACADWNQACQLGDCRRYKQAMNDKTCR